ncbi:hypothetical protein F8388_025049 [Cannabis sativa]|uniref:Uncharacterized protein n=1 Tax=Cannabis sativa TaxID=3483 RepID=A0A7J6FLQ1_CANSA|nr:hypothetical protein F8388_025049 [Cannabis sativa]
MGNNPAPAPLGGANPKNFCKLVRILIEQRKYKNAMEQSEAKDDKEDEGNDGAGFELKKREIAARFLETGLNPINLLGFRLFGGDLVGSVSLHGFELLRGFVNGGSEGLVGVGSVY